MKDLNDLKRFHSRMEISICDSISGTIDLYSNHCSISSKIEQESVEKKIQSLIDEVNEQNDSC